MIKQTEGYYPLLLLQYKISSGLLYSENFTPKVFMRLICHSAKWMSDLFYSCIWLVCETAFIPTRTPTTVVGIAIPKKLVGTIYFDNSCVIKVLRIPAT